MAEAIYKINYDVDRATAKITPTAPQKAGYYGDDKAAQITFSKVEKTLKYQIEIVDGNGAYDITETLTPNGSGQIVYLVPSAWTAAGLASVRLVEIGDHVLHYPDVHLLFEARESGDQMGEMLPRWQSVMRDAETATDDANEAAEYATQAGEYAEAHTPNIKDGNWYLGDQNTGTSATGVYVGSGDMPDGCNVQIDPEGDVLPPTAISHMINARVYMGEFWYTSFTRNTETGTLDVFFSARPTLIYNGATKALLWTDEFLSDISWSVTIVSEYIAIIHIKQGDSLVFNVDDMKWHMRTRNDVKTGDITCVSTSTAWALGGTLVEEYMMRQARYQAGEDVTTKAKKQYKAFSSLVATAGSNIDSFLFFTDPHLGGLDGSASYPEDHWKSEFQRYAQFMKTVYNESPVDFAICGGDWLNSGDSVSEASFKLAYIDKQMRSVFSRYYPVVGNHDYNYLGLDETRITAQGIRNLWKCDLCYKFTTDNTTFFVFDTGVDDDHKAGEMTDYDREQLAWFEDELERVTTPNIAIAMHIVRQENGTYHALASNVLSRCKDHNDNGGGSRVRFCLCGHMHADYAETIFGIPVVETRNAKGTEDESFRPSFDLCLADYDNNKLHLVRVGTGDDRIIDI